MRPAATNTQRVPLSCYAVPDRQGGTYNARMQSGSPVSPRSSTDRPVGASAVRGAGAPSPLEKPVQYVRGVGPTRARHLAELNIHTIGDLLWHFPFRFEDQGRPQPIDSLLLDEPATVVAVVESVRYRGGYGQSNINATVHDGTGKMFVTWFNAGYMRDRLERGQVLRLHGKVGMHQDHAQMVNPSVEWLDPDDDPKNWDYARLVPIYRASARLTSAQIARLVDAALQEGLPAIEETLPADLLAQRGLPGLREAVRAMHQPRDMAEWAAARRRMAYEELFLMQLAISLQRRFTAERAAAPVLTNTEEIDARIRRRFPFPLTPAQDRVVREIAADLGRSRPMTRLLQGDVGSGKTVVALYAALLAVANRRQVAILAPTEVLAAQHFAGIEKFLAGSRVTRCLLTGKVPPAERERALRAIATGQMNLVVGTQALLESKVQFHSLGLVIVDEQHKFGVMQRATIRGKARAPGRASGGATPRADRRVQPRSIPHYLVMTATPIPRTLSMTVFGDLDVSIIDQLPPGRQPIVTRIVGEKDEPQAWAEVRRRIAAGEQAYIVYPLVEESEALDLKAATAEVDHVRELLPGVEVGLLHGRMRQAAKAAVMREFARGKLGALVSTTVIEVGVDVPNATVMVIQHAERYGLAALHQLRGRVGRGSKPSICLLMSDNRSELAQRRLSILCETTDGFRIAEEDLKIRGPGELLGTRQHGWPEFTVANLVEDVDLLMQARDDAAAMVRDDERLTDVGHGPLRAELRRRFRDKVAFIDVG